MKTTTLMTMAAMLGSMAWAAAKSDDQKVVACIEVNKRTRMVWPWPG